VREIITKYKDDERIVIWDLYNEVGAGRREMVSQKHLRKFFEIAWEIDPVQPLTACVWRCPERRTQDYRPIEKIAAELSDIISYHSYQSYESNVRVIRRLKEFGRPIINTEWLGRCLHNTVQQMFPLFYLEKIGCWNWGFVAGKYQTYEPWNGVWEQYEQNPDMDVDFTKWFHDLYRPSLHPYDPKEIELIQRFCALADEDFRLGK